MSLLTIDRNPSKQLLRSFGLLLAMFVPLFGALVWWRTGRIDTARTVWIAGGVLTIIYWAAPPIRRPVFVGWMYAAFPIGWTISHLLMGCIFYGVITPIAWIMRASGRDPLARTFDRSARSYWVPHERSDDIGRYFRQY
ncbi:MAG: SxtJ family membrane protein [Vicinamibacterales bacterium]